MKIKLFLEIIFIPLILKNQRIIYIILNFSKISILLKNQILMTKFKENLDINSKSKVNNPKAFNGYIDEFIILKKFIDDSEISNNLKIDKIYDICN